MNTPTLARPAGQLHPAHPSLRDITQDDLLLASASAVFDGRLASFGKGEEH